MRQEKLKEIKQRISDALAKMIDAFDKWYEREVRDLKVWLYTKVIGMNLTEIKPPADGHIYINGNNTVIMNKTTLDRITKAKTKQR